MEQLTEFVSKSFTSDHHRLALSNIVSTTTSPPPTSVTNSITSPTIPTNSPFSSNHFSPSSFSLFRNHPSSHSFPFPSSSVLHSMVDRLSSINHHHPNGFPPLHFFTNGVSPFTTSSLPFHSSRSGNLPPVDLSLGTTTSINSKLMRDRSPISPVPSAQNVCDRSEPPRTTSLTDGDSRQSLDPDGISGNESDDDRPNSSTGKVLLHS